MDKVLITDCWTRKALSIVRALGKEQIDVHCISHTLLSPPIYSKYCRKYYIFPSPRENPDKYSEMLIELIKEEHFKCIIPLEEPTIDILYKAKETIELYTKITLPSKESYIIANDKWETIQLARNLEIPLPDSYLTDDKEDINKIIQNLKFPLVLKPRHSSGSRGLRKVNNTDEFNKYHHLIKAKYGIPIIQECLPVEGQGLGVACLVENGNTKKSFSYKRLREYPVNGGPGTLNESTDDPVIKDYAAKIMKELNWTGIAMVEFKIDTRDSLPKLLEINPRFWGSVHLSIVAGINFPYLLYQQTVHSPQAIFNSSAPVYSVGIRSRWLIAGDLMHFIQNPNRFRLKPSFLRFRDKYTFYSQYDNTDFKGNIAVIICNILQLFSIKRWRHGVFRK
jgi:predicted ATP-grasp superfamily ATP-dependent carboligase